jgi:1-deoxy-D-xylulose-5-phosphate reductoisomerase
MQSAPQRDVILLGSTGSIGTQAADIVRRNPGRFRLTGLAAGGGNPGLLAAQALEFGVDVIAVADQGAAGEVAGGPTCWPARTRSRSWRRASATWC